jgi:hypothetical protein
MKNLAKLILIVTMFTSIAIADDGHTGGGNRCETCTPPPCTENCVTDNGGITELEMAAQESEEGNESILDYFTKVIMEMIG